MATTETPDKPEKAHKTDKPPRDEASTPTVPRTLRVQLGLALQRHRLRRGLTQAQLAEFADLSLKYIGEIERGEANTTLEAIERIAQAVGWDPMNALEGFREPITEGVRLLLITEAQDMLERLRAMVRWLEAIDPLKHPHARLSPAVVPAPPPGTALPAPHKTVRSRARPSRARKT